MDLFLVFNLCQVNFIFRILIDRILIIPQKALYFLTSKGISAANHSNLSRWPIRLPAPRAANDEWRDERCRLFAYEHSDDMPAQWWSLRSWFELGRKLVRRSRASATTTSNSATADDRKWRQQPQHPLAQHAARNRNRLLSRSANQLQIQELDQAEVLGGEGEVVFAARVKRRRTGQAAVLVVSRGTDLRSARRRIFLRAADGWGIPNQTPSKLHSGHRARYRFTSGHDIG